MLIIRRLLVLFQQKELVLRGSNRTRSGSELGNFKFPSSFQQAKSESKFVDAMHLWCLDDHMNKSYNPFTSDKEIELSKQIRPTTPDSRIESLDKTVALMVQVQDL